MGWKYTKDLARAEAMGLIMERLHEASNEELANAVEALGYGDNTELSHFGANFCVVDTYEDKED